MVATFALIALHVRSVALSSSTLRPALNVPFTVTVSIQVKENVSSLPDVYLPTFFGPEELGDDRSYAHGPNGTTYRETMTLEAHTSGPLHISPAYMDAIDARDGRPKRFISNPLTLYVQGVPLITAAWSTLRALAALIVYGLLALAAAFVVVATFGRRKKRVREDPIKEPPAPAPAAEPEPAEDRIDTAVRQLRDRRDRFSVLAVRSLLWNAAGAASGETLGDVLGRLPASASRERRLALFIEHAAFADDSQMQRAIAEFLSQYDGSVLA